MDKPRVVEVKRPPAKPKIVAQKDKAEPAEDYSLLVDTPRDELRKQQMRDIQPFQPEPGTPLQGDELRAKIESDRKKRRGIVGDAKDLLGLR